MKPYVSKSGKRSGVNGFSIHDQEIVVRFVNHDLYTYTYASAGKTTVEKMKKLALASEGLSTFIAQHQPGFEK
ncbi:MAG: hypothetical protein INR69_08125 [Mucilaginibacter polytrichastri]|nr:hypothetical protein [Mucilaginibacter polytrichastri]